MSVDSLQPAVHQATIDDRQQWDKSCRTPVLFLFLSSLFWLIVGSTLALLASLKMHMPEFLTDWSFLTFGRVRPAHLNTVAYGWATMSGVGVAFWMMCRLSHRPLVAPFLANLGTLIWNVGVAVGTVGILIGNSTSIEWLEFPKSAPPILACGLLMMSLVMLLTFFGRRERHVYVTQWYIIGAVVWMPALYVIATILCVYLPAKGVIQSTVNWWYAHNVLGLWMTPIGIGAAYYLIPKVIGRPVHSYRLSLIGFWTLALFYSWAGMHHLIGGPIPAWLITASTMASIMMFIPVIAVAINHHLTMRGHFKELRYSPTLRFVVFGAMAYTAVSFQGSIEALRSFNVLVHFTHYTVAHAHLGLYGFFTMTMFGAGYYIIPRLTGRQWQMTWLIKAHFWLTAGGITLYFVALTIGGLYQGNALLNPSIKFIRVVIDTLPYLELRSYAGIAMTLGHLIFALLVCMNVVGFGRPLPPPQNSTTSPDSKEFGTP